MCLLHGYNSFVLTCVRWTRRWLAEWLWRSVTSTLICRWRQRSEHTRTWSAKQPNNIIQPAFVRAIKFSRCSVTAGLLADDSFIAFGEMQLLLASCLSIVNSYWVALITGHILHLQGCLVDLLCTIQAVAEKSVNLVGSRWQNVVMCLVIIGWQFVVLCFTVLSGHMQMKQRSSFSALMLLVGRQEGHPARKSSAATIPKYFLGLA